MSCFVSTRNKNEVVDSRHAIINGLSGDGGLYVPVTIPRLDYRKLIGLSYPQAALHILRSWFDDFDTENLQECCEQAYSHFDDKDVCPVISAGNTNITELFHGETYAFKDVALSLLPRIMVKAQKSLGIDDKILILTATSGDTGSAAMNGFRNVEGTGIIVFYPHVGVSAIQRKQMVCMDGNNITACAVDGNFDDCQTAVKQVFTTLPHIDGVRLSSANSINIARLVPQIAYYFTTYIGLVKSGRLADGETMDFIVPTGNFGDILAGYYAKHMGLPVGNLVCASNANNVLTDFFHTGVYDRRREFFRTWSPSMDILVSSNLERLLYHSQNGDTELVREQMSKLKSDGYYQIDADTINIIRGDFDAYCCDDKLTAQTIKGFFESTGYVLDPHTAVAVYAEKEYRKMHPERVCAVMSTASPYKFPVSILDALGYDSDFEAFEPVRKLSSISKMPAPKGIEELATKPELHTDVIGRESIKDYVTSHISELFR